MITTPESFLYYTAMIRLRRAAWRLHRNELLAISRRNLFDDEASSSNNTRTKPSTPLKTLREHSLPNSFGFQNPIVLPAEQTWRIVISHDILLIQGTCTFQELKREDPLYHIRHYLSIVDKIQDDEATRDISRLCFFHFSLKGKTVKWLDKMPPTQITTWDQLVSQFLEGDIYNDPSLLRLYQYDDIPPWGNNKRKEKGEDGLEWVVRSKFEGELANFMLEKKFHTKGIGEMLDQHRKGMHEQFSQILSTIKKTEIPEPEAPTFTITTRSGISTRDPPFPAPSQSTPANHVEGATEKKDPRMRNQAVWMKKPPGHPFSINPPSH
ncbi:hypothetical protein Tco_0625307 [Tanacetum coccineum]|uniref:Retrotransposon gag domain-containing protein n=1 Tax=Tanacetum coccineum TaxID=301880 RepID=A0ABQ4WGF2_9ASTR